MATSEGSQPPLDLASPTIKSSAVVETPLATKPPMVVETPPASAGIDVATPQHRALAPVIGRSGVDGIPARYADGKEWLEHGIRRHPKGALVALFCAWTGFYVALWGAAIGAVFGVLVALGAITNPAIGHSLLGLTVGQAVTPLAVVSGLILGIIGGFFVVLGWLVVNQPLQWTVGMVSGLILAAVVLVTVAAFERLGLRLRGYRRLSRDEVRRG